jgi:S1-C subfamily serine protease
VVNNGHEYVAKTVYTDAANDIAILQIADADWKPKSSLPYGIRKNNADLGEELFTLGYPRNSIVYNRGYLSAGTGYNDDSLSIQLSISANPGNSGGPVLDKNGNIIGILSTRDRQADDVVFATKASNINRAIEELKKDSAFKDLQIPGKSNIRNLDRVEQIKRLQDCVFMVKAYN